MKRLSVLLSFTTGCLVLICSSAVDRHRLHSLSFREGRPRIGFSWDRGAYEPGERLEVFYTSSLTSSWKLVHTEFVSAETSDVEYEFKDIRPDADGGFFTVRRFVDSDGDGTSDAQEELEYRSNPFSLDSDFDTIPDEYEIAHGMNPADPDTDHDGVPDEFEIRFGSNPLFGDTDHDGISDCDEWLIYFTDLTRADTDGDFVDDLEEIEHGLDPNRDYSGDPRFPDRVTLPLEGRDPYSYPVGSTNACWVHAFYSGYPDGPIVYPESTDHTAVLKMTVSGTGGGVVKVGGRSYSVFGHEEPKSRSFLAVQPESGQVLLAGVARGFRNDISVDAPDSLKISFSSDDFMVGELPTEAFENGVHVGWVGFPNTAVKPPCIHYFGKQSRSLNLDPGWSTSDVTCTSMPAEGLNVENHPPRSAVISGEIGRGSLEGVRYRLWHPLYLQGQCEFRQRVNYCLEEDDDEEEEGSGEGSHPTGDYEQDLEDGVLPHEHRDQEVEPVADEDLETLMKLPKRQGVLKLRDEIVGEKIDLTVPEKQEVCCGCPEHQACSVVLRNESGSLNVVDGNGATFQQTTVNQSIYVFGTVPSSSVGDSVIQFNCGNKILDRRAYTVLGLDIRSPLMDLKLMRAWSYELGVPVCVGEYDYNGIGWMSPDRAESGVDLSLDCNVGLSGGKIRLEFVNAEGQFQLWYPRAGDGVWECLIDTESHPSIEMSLAAWRSMMNIATTGSVDVRVFANSVGQTTLKWSYACRSGGEVVCDEVKQLITGVAPRLIFDWDRNGRIEPHDRLVASEGQSFRSWVNDDKDAKETEEGLVDLSGEGGNCTDEKINGKRDLVDFTPVCVDLTDAFPKTCSSSVRDAVVWKIASDCVNIVQTALQRDQAGAFQTQDLGPFFGENIDRELLSAKVERTSDGCELNPRLARAAVEQGGYGILLMEGCAPGHDLRLEGWLIGKDREFKLMEYRANISVSKVGQMYRWIDIRQTENLSLPISDSGQPSNWSGTDYSGADDRNFVFVHGFNVNVLEARAWAAEMYKRMWQAGFDGQFVAVDWTGDSSQFHSRLLDDNYAPDYYVNVRNAFRAAAVLPKALRNVGSRNYLLAHSLGNMLVSSAAVDHQLEYERYYMLNAAVPMEAYDATAYAGAMVDTEWSLVPREYWASNWNQLFVTDDFRHSLNWHGRFTGLRNVVNAYSVTEDVLGNPKSGQLTYVGGAWKTQELSKGTTTWYDLNAVSLQGLDVVCEGGWGIASQYATNPLWYIYQYGFTSYVGSNITRNLAITEPLFTPFCAYREQMQSSTLFRDWQIKDPAELRARFLGDAIPATSFAQGANAASPKLNWANVSLTELADHLDSWPRGTPKNGACEWRHSDLKNLPYFYVHKLFEKIVKGE